MRGRIRVGVGVGVDVGYDWGLILATTSALVTLASSLPNASPRGLADKSPGACTAHYDSSDA